MSEYIDDPNFISFLDSEWYEKSTQEKAEELFGDLAEAVFYFKQSDYYEDDNGY